MAELKIEGISAGYGSDLALKDIRLDIGGGQMLGVLGPSGCGKTTLLRCIAGLEIPRQGTIKIGDDTVFDAGSKTFMPPQDRNVAMVFQDLALWPHMSVAGHLEFVLGPKKLPKKEREKRVGEALALLCMVELAERFPHELSGGERQRLAIMRAIVQRPRLLLLDEPLSNLDPILRADITEQFRAVKESLGITTVYVTHDMGHIRGLAEKIAVIKDGTIVQKGTTDEVMDAPANDFVSKITCG